MHACVFVCCNENASSHTIRLNPPASTSVLVGNLQQSCLIDERISVAKQKIKKKHNGELNYWMGSVTFKVTVTTIMCDYVFAYVHVCLVRKDHLLDSY